MTTRDELDRLRDELDDLQRTLPFWILLSGATAAGPWLGRVMGGRALSDAIPWLQRVLETPIPEVE